MCALETLAGAYGYEKFRTEHVIKPMGLFVLLPMSLFIKSLVHKFDGIINVSTISG